VRVVGEAGNEVCLVASFYSTKRRFLTREDYRRESSPGYAASDFVAASAQLSRQYAGDVAQLDCSLSVLG